MMRRGLFLKFTLLVMFSGLMLAGCRSSAPPVEFYTLNSLTRMQEKENSAEADQNIAIGIGPVEIPQILDRPQIVTRTGPNRIKVDDFHRWAGSLEEDFARVVAENISLLLATDQVAVFPWEAGFKPRYQIALDVMYFEGRWDKNVLLEVNWRVLEPESSKTVVVGRSVIKEPLAAENYEALVAAKSKAVVKLSRKIVQEIQNLKSRQKVANCSG